MHSRQSSNVAIIFASDNYGHEEADTTTLNLPNNQDALISAVAAANPNTIVVLSDNSAIMMPWLNQVRACSRPSTRARNSARRSRPCCSAT